MLKLGFPGGALVKNLPANAGDAGDSGSIPGLGRSPREGNDKPHQTDSSDVPALMVGGTLHWRCCSDAMAKTFSS